MHISFSTPLRSHTRIYAPVVTVVSSESESSSESVQPEYDNDDGKGIPGPSKLERREDFVEVVFSAFVPREDQHELQNNNIRLEVWTNIPKGNYYRQDDLNSDPAEWGPVVFKDVKRVNLEGSDSSEQLLPIALSAPPAEFESETQAVVHNNTSTTSSISNSISDKHQSTLNLLLSSNLEAEENRIGVNDTAGLDSKSEASAKDDEVKELKASLFIPTSRQRTFSFTYRLVYAAGWIRWLGTVHSNGYIDVIVDAAQAFFVEEPGWSYNALGYRSFSAKGTNSSDGEIVLGRVNTTSDFWSASTGWAITPEGVEKLDLTSDNSFDRCYFLIFSLRTHLEKIHLRRPLIISSSSKDTSVKITSGGDLIIQSGNAEGYIKRITYGVDLDNLEQALLKIGYNALYESMEALVIAKKDDAAVTYSASVLTVSTSMPAGGWDIRLSYSPLKALFPDAECISFFSVKTLKSVFLDWTSVLPADLHLKTGIDGGEFIISPVFNLRKDKSLQIAFASPVSSRPRITENNINFRVLPTPPASPQPYRRKQNKPIFADRNEYDAFASIDDTMTMSAKANNKVGAVEERKSGESGYISQKLYQIKQPSESSGTVDFLIILAQYFVMTSNILLHKLWNLLLLLINLARSSLLTVSPVVQVKAVTQPEQSERIEQSFEQGEITNNDISVAEGSNSNSQKPFDENDLPHAIANTKDHTEKVHDSPSKPEVSLAIKDHVMVRTITVQSRKPDEYILEWENQTLWRQDFIVKDLTGEPAELSFYVQVSGKEIEAKTLAIINESTRLYGLESLSELYV